jgi:rfaE bifunctional protein nucleotidyltransferase chain/domain
VPDLIDHADRKILSLNELTVAVAAHKGAGRTIAHCHGVFDLVHPGHIRHLRAASREANLLVVTVTGDKYVNKGPGRPVYKAELRAEILASLEYVDFVAINEAPSAVDVINRLRPDVYVKGSDYASPDDDVTGMIVEEAAAVASGGGRVHFTDEIVMSSSELINTYFDVFRPETQSWLKALRERHPAAEIVKHIHRLRDVNVLVIGEAIIDEYIFCEVLGRSSKDPLLAFKYGSTETFAGGSLAVANHSSRKTSIRRSI